MVVNEIAKITENMEPVRHWMGFDVFIWSWPTPTFALFENKKSKMSVADELKLYYNNEYTRT